MGGPSTAGGRGASGGGKGGAPTPGGALGAGRGACPAACTGALATAWSGLAATFRSW